MTAPLLDIQELVVGPMEAPWLGPVSLQVGHGGALAFLGPNGAGKSTLLKAIMGLARPSSGAIRLCGAPITAKSRRQVGYAPEGRRPFPGLTTEENLLAVSHETFRRRSARLAEVYEQFPALAQRRHAEAWRLSGGEQQMLAIGRALMRRPQLLLLDEPTLGLAPSTIDLLMAALAQIRQEGVAVVLAEQRVGDALAFADQVAFLAQGQVSAAGKAAEFSDIDAISRRYLG